MDYPETVTLNGISFDNPLNFPKDYAGRARKIDAGTRKEAYSIGLYEYHDESKDGRPCIFCWQYTLTVTRGGACEIDGKRVADKKEQEWCKNLISALELKYGK